MMLRQGSYYLVTGLMIFFLAFISCLKDLDPLTFPTVETLEPNRDSIAIGSIRLRAEIDPLSSTPIKVGFEWWTNRDSLTIYDTSYSMPFDKKFIFEKVITGLKLNQLYYCQAHAEFIDPEHVDGIRKVTGIISSFILGVNITVPFELPVFNDSTVLSGNVEGLRDDINVMNHGFVFNAVNSKPMINDGLSHIIELGMWDGEKSLKNTSIVNLEFNTTYHYRAWMRTDTAIYYSNIGIFKVNDGWKRISDVDVAFQEGVAASNGELAYVIGGCTSQPNCGSDIGNNNFVLSYNLNLNSWLNLVIAPPPIQRHNALAFILNDTLYFGFGEQSDFSNAVRNSTYKLDLQTGNWTNVKLISNNAAVLPRSRAISFCINSNNYDKAYFGTGKGIDSLLNDFWEFDPVLDTCRRMADLPARFEKSSVSRGRRDAMAFSLNQHGYVMCGITVGNLDLNDVWKFTPPVAGNPDDKGKWEFVEFFPGPLRSRGVAFTVGEKAFMALGYNTANNLQELNDLWEFVPEPEAGASHFQSRVSFPGEKRENAVAFVIADKAYVGSGQNDAETLGDFWIYTPKKD